MHTLRHKRICNVLLILSAFLSLFVLIAGCHIPLLDQHSFRQTQTAISTYWLLHGGNWLAYETPVLGSPWAIPFEFPLYQWIVALTSSILPISLDNVGRIVSYIFQVCCLAPLYVLFRTYNLSRQAFLFT